MPRWKSTPAVLTIAGSDSGGEAGIQADLKVFQALGAHGLSAVTCLTAQNPDSVRAVKSVPRAFLSEQLAAIRDFYPIHAVKTGMLASRPLVEATVDFLSSLPRRPVVVDPVMRSTSDAALLKGAGVKAMMASLFPAATLVTPNIPEAERIVQHPIASIDDMADAAQAIYDRFGCAALVKGGHLGFGDRSIDALVCGSGRVLLEAPRARRAGLHGTGCVYASAIAAYLSRGKSLMEAVELGKHFITQAIHASIRIHRHRALNLGGAPAEIKTN